MWRSIFAFLIFSTPALADAIDGDWCLAEKHLAIVGSKITLPTDAVTQGEYRGHEFLYQVPVGEVDAGSLIYMQLQGEDNMSLYHLKDGKPVDGQSWLRCLPNTTS